jgi:hypothetical protein
MTTPQFIACLTAKVVAYFRSKKLSAKVIPPVRILAEHLRQETRAALERRVVDEVLRAANIPGQVEAAFATFHRSVAARAKALARELPGRLDSTPEAHWTHLVRADAAAVALAPGGENG